MTFKSCSSLMSVGEFIAKYKMNQPQDLCSLAGRIVSRREVSKGLSFFTLYSDSTFVQVVGSSKNIKMWDEFRKNTHVGDVLCTFKIN